MKFDIEDTAIGRQKRVFRREIKTPFKGMTKDERLEYIEERKKRLGAAIGITGPAVQL